MIFKSTKRFANYPCSHQQYQDDGGAGQCAQVHGYSREFIFEFQATTTDAYGWVVGFSSLNKVKEWLDYLFDHTSLWEAADPRLDAAIEMSLKMTPRLFNVRVLPSGVSMEQTALFLSTYINPYILDQTDGRCWISKLEVRENDKNSGIIELTRDDALSQAEWHKNNTNGEMMPHQPFWGQINPNDWVEEINSYTTNRLMDNIE